MRITCTSTGQLAVADVQSVDRGYRPDGSAIWGCPPTYRYENAARAEMFTSVSRSGSENLGDPFRLESEERWSNYFQAADGGSFLNDQFPSSSPPPPSSQRPVEPPADAGRQRAACPGQDRQDHPGRRYTPIGAPFQDAPGQTFDRNCAVNTIYSANLTSVNSNPNSNGLLPSQNDSNPNDSTRPNTRRSATAWTAAVSWSDSGGWDAALAGWSHDKRPMGARPSRTQRCPNFQFWKLALESRPVRAATCQPRAPPWKSDRVLRITTP